MSEYDPPYRSISDLEAEAIRIRAGDYELRRWPDDTFLVENLITGEATQVQESAIVLALHELFRTHF
jgi:hypothetical protein